MVLNSIQIEKLARVSCFDENDNCILEVIDNFNSIKNRINSIYNLTINEDKIKEWIINDK